MCNYPHLSLTWQICYKCPRKCLGQAILSMPGPTRVRAVFKATIVLLPIVNLVVSYVLLIFYIHVRKDGP